MSTAAAMETHGGGAPLSHSDKRAIAAACFADPVRFCKTFLSHLFPGRIPWLHRAVLSILTGRTGFLDDDPDLDKIIRNFVFVDTEGRSRPLFARVDGHVALVRRKFLEIMLPRGFAKTTIAGIAVPVYDTLYETVDFGCYISEAGPHAEMQLDNVKRELTDNARILEVFGDRSPKSANDEHWSAKLFETVGDSSHPGVAWVARGRGAQVRGLNHRGRRPSKIILDDVEDKESVSTELQREKTRTWFYSDVVPALPLIKPGQIVALGTLLHPEAMLEILSRDPRWSVVRFGPYDNEGELLWPEGLDEGKLEALRQSAILAGQLGNYYLEYFNRSHDEESAKFKRSYFKYGKPQEADVIVAAATYMDPAISKKANADQTVIMTVRQTDKGKIFVSAGWGKRGASQDEVMNEYFRQHRIYRPRFHGVESNGFQIALVHEMRRQMFERKTYFEVTPVKNTNSKSERILGVLQGRFASEYIVFEERFGELEGQLLDFNPDRDLHDDWPDALAGAIQLLDPVAGYSGGGNEDNEKDIPSVEEAIREAQRADRHKPRYRGSV